MKMNAEARLILEDGSLFKGRSRGVNGEAQGEVVFNTSMTGYQEIITDPSCCGHILTMTFPLMGSYGINKEDFESRSPFLRGFIAREICSSPSNWRAGQSLPDYLLEQNIIAMDSVDTRALVRLIREKGSLRGILTTAGTSYPLLLEKVRQSPAISTRDLVAAVSTPEIYTLGNGPGNDPNQEHENGSRNDNNAWSESTGWSGRRGPHLAILDLGLKFSLLRLLQARGCRITVVPAAMPATDIMQLKPAGLVLAGGPGDPRQAKTAIETVQKLAGKIPLWGLGLGHQVIALALGGKTYKLKFGHRGDNHPVRDLRTQKISITSQNHGFAVEEASLPPGLTVTHRHLHDDTVEGLQDKKLKIITCQYAPGDLPPGDFPGWKEAFSNA